MVKIESVDRQMASHKEAMDYGQAMIVCGLCSRRPENLMMLTFLAERLLQLSEAVLRRLAQGDGDGDDEERPAFVFGELELGSAPEWGVLVGSLTVLHLGSLRRLMCQLRKRAESVRANTIHKKKIETERLTGELMDRVRAAGALAFVVVSRRRTSGLIAPL